MNTRLQILTLAQRHGLDAAALARLQQLAGVHEAPSQFGPWLGRLAALLGAALGGLGLVMWVAANWAELGRLPRFALLQGLIVALCLGAIARPAARPPLTLLAFVALGALLAYFGQTYQTGADAWQLFALWALLGLPLVLGLRSDLLWTPWALVAMLAIALWTYTHAAPRWGHHVGDVSVHLLGFGAMLALGAALALPLRRHAGAGLWSLRLVALLSMLSVVSIALGALFQTPVGPQYGLGVLVLATAAAGPLLRRALADVFVLSTVAGGLNILLVVGLGRWVLSGASGTLERLLGLGVMALLSLGLMAASVRLILQHGRPQAQHP
ncbi:DUF2157 domain-containing protein [Roseateles sp. BYS180W]|uniref:DUF2157 domain-containing protein n=1 Tax=Roseateles rivi TaxID=3299028 RepID=A0ABW7FSP6_9BURK